MGAGVGCFLGRVQVHSDVSGRADGPLGAGLGQLIAGHHVGREPSTRADHQVEVDVEGVEHLAPEVSGSNVSVCLKKPKETHTCQFGGAFAHGALCPNCLCHTGLPKKRREPGRRLPVQVNFKGHQKRAEFVSTSFYWL